jgi:2'-5' RNA ligase
MQDSRRRDELVVVALFTDVPRRMTLDRRRWPPHVTIAPNFGIGAPTALVTDIVRRVAAGVEAIDCRVQARAMFGPKQDVPVHLVAPDGFAAWHDRLTDDFEQLPGFAADEPDYWRAGYRPHVTLGSAAAVREGEIRPVRCIATVRLEGVNATVLDVVPLPLT